MKPQDLSFVEEIASIIEGRTGYKWLPDLTRYGTGSVVLVFNTGGYPPYVACKTTIKPCGEGVLKIFLKEVWRTLKVKAHPLVLPVIYVAVIRGRPLIFMRYYKQNLREYLLKKKVLAVDEALAIAVQVVKGLLHLKKQGFIAHQDLKPENILLEDLRELFGAENILPQLSFRVKVADFGLANALIEAGILGGSNPYRAPEQFPCYLEAKIGDEVLRSERPFDPDVFALGVIITEMITGKHPCGLSSDEALRLANDSRFWEQWSIRGERLVEIENKGLKELALKMLNPRPSERPELEEVYRGLMEILRSIDPRVHEQLEVSLMYWDDLAKEYEEMLSDADILRNVLRLSGIPEALDLVKDYAEHLRQRIKEISPPKSPKEVYGYVKLCCRLGEALAAIDKDRYREEVVELGLNCIDLLSRWRGEIKAEHTPYKKITDYEACALVMGYALDLLRVVLSEQEIERMVGERYDDYLRSLYWFNRASNAHGRADYERALQNIEEALRHSPGNATLLYFRALWKYQWALVKMMEVHVLLKEALDELRRLHALEPTWKEVKRTLEEVEARYNELKRSSMKPFCDDAL